MAVLLTWPEALFSLLSSPFLLARALPLPPERIEYYIRGPRSSSFWVPLNLSLHMTGQARTSDTAHCKENSIYVLKEKKLRSLSPNSYIHVSVSDLYIPTIGPPIFL